MSENFPDMRARCMPDCVAEFSSAVRPDFWVRSTPADAHARDTAALIGDAAHAIVPFHGQGMNCCFEDCVEFDACLDRSSSCGTGIRSRVLRACRKPNTDAIAEMALENYLEMRERVADPGFLMQRSLALELERRFPDRFIPRYSMVMFHHEIPYRVAMLERGAIQTRLLAGSDADRGSDARRGRLCPRRTRNRVSARADSGPVERPRKCKRRSWFRPLRGASRNDSRHSAPRQPSKNVSPSSTRVCTRVKWILRDEQQALPVDLQAPPMTMISASDAFRSVASRRLAGLHRRSATTVQSARARNSIGLAQHQM